MSSKVVHFTDLEGDWNHLEQNIDALNKEYEVYLSMVGEGEARFLQIPEGVSVVFGGDLIDNGRYDLDLLHLFNNTKQLYPERLTLIAGNRDLNKLRVPKEINDTHPKALLQAESQLPAKDKNKTGHARLALELTWVDGGKMTFTAFCSKELNCHLDDVLTFFERTDKVGQKILYTKWMLSQTMGAPYAWDFRRQYLEEREENASDEAILHSFIDEFSPIGPVARYLQNAVLAEKIGNVGFTHGALNAESYHPMLGDEQKDYASFDALVTGLNSWFSEFVSQYYQRVCAPDFGQSEEDEKLLAKKKQVDLMSLPAQAATGTQKATSTVVTNHYMTNGMTLPIDEGFKAPLEASQVFIHVAGHRPHANIPGFASRYQAAERGLVKGLQAVVTDSCKNREERSAALTLIEEMPNGISSVHRFARDSEGRTLVKTKTPGFDRNGYVYDRDGQPFNHEDVLLHHPELLVGSKTIRVLDQYYRAIKKQNKLLNEGWEITAYNQDTMTYTLCKVGSPDENFQIASINLPADQVYFLIETMEADAKKAKEAAEKEAKNEKKRTREEATSDDTLKLPETSLAGSIRHTAFPPPPPPSEVEIGSDEDQNLKTEGPGCN